MKILIKTCIIIALFLSISSHVSGQSDAHVFGHVVCEGEHIPFVNVLIKGTRLGSTTDITGHYMITNVPPGSYVIKFQAMGYKSKEIHFEINERQSLEIDFEVEREDVLLDQVVITGTMKEISLKDSPVKIEVITARHLSRIPNSNLIEAIEMINGLQNCSDCSVCGTTGIHINGMSSTSTAVLIDGMPIMGALASVYGLNGIPTEMIERIEVIKGPSSTLYGSEAVAGVVNIITKNPLRMPLFSYNHFISADGESNIDFAVAPIKHGKLRMLFSGNYYTMNSFIDDNKDGFADMVLVNPRISLFNKWSLKRKDNRVFDLAFKGYHENRLGGTQAFLGHYDFTRDNAYRGNDSIYGESVFTDRFEVLGSYQLPLISEKVKFDFSHSYHHQNAWYADEQYMANQIISYGHLLWDKKMGLKNDVLMGLSLRFQTYDDNTDIIAEKDEQLIPGIFVQNAFKASEKITLLGGLRMDNHKNHGNIFSPRLSFKWSPETYTTFRLNSGTGFRIVNLFSEEHAAYHGFRQLVIANDIQPEQSYNLTLSANRIFNLGASAWTFDADVFYTYFTNKIISDYDTDPTKIIYDNIQKGDYAVSRGVAASINASFLFPLSVNIGGTWQDVYVMETDENDVRNKEMVVKAPSFLGNYSLSYDFKKTATSIDFTGNLYGKMRMPTFEPPFERPEYSKPYGVHNVQIKQTLKHNTQIYFAVKNMFDFKQSSPLINPQNPFHESFDTSYVYAPLIGRRFIIGLRLNIV